MMSLLATSCRDSYEHKARVSPELESYKENWRRYNTLAQDDSVLIFSRPIFKQALRTGDTLTALYCGVYMAQAWLFMEYNDSALNMLSRMEDVMDTQKDNVLKYLYWSIYGGYAIKADMNYSKAMEFYNKGYEAAVASGNVGNQLRILLDIIYIFYIRGDANGMKYAQEAYALAQTEGMSVEDRCTAEIMMAMMSHLQGNDTAALRYINDAAVLADSASLEPLYSLIYKVNGDLWTDRQEYSEARRCYRQALKYAYYADAGTETMVYLDYGRMLQKAGLYADAEDILHKGLKISYANENHEYRKELLSALLDNALETGRNDEAAMWAGVFRSYVDSISSLQREKDFNAMLMSIQQVEYENRAQAAELEYLRSRQRMMANMAVLVIIVLVCVFMLVMYRRQRNTYKLLVEKYQKYAEQFKKESDRSVQNTDMELFQRVETMMREQKVYRMKSLTRDSLADMLGTNRTYLSRAINSVSGKSFSDYVNTWRIIEATQIMADDTKDIPLKQLADDLGYNSTAVFYRCFQKETGVTAGKYMREVRAMRV